MHFPAKQPFTNDTVCNASDCFNGIEILQGRRQHGEKVGYCYPSGLEKTLCKWDIYVYVPLVTKGLNDAAPDQNTVKTKLILAVLTIHYLRSVRVGASR
jgi:hypothetical protein